MTQKICNKIKEKLDSLMFQNYAKSKGYTKIETYLTKTDENINLSGKDRAAVAKNKEADIFLVIHFNSYDDTSLLKRAENRGGWEQTHILDITKNVSGTKRDRPKGFRRRFYSSSSAHRGPQMLFRNDMPTEIQGKSTLVSNSIRSNLKKTIEKEDISTKIKDTKNLIGRYGAISPANTGVGTKGAKKIIPVYLECDYINVESGDRIWNWADYNSQINYRRTELKVPKNESGAYDVYYTPLVPAAEFDFYDIAAKAIATSLIDNLVHRIPK